MVLSPLLRERALARIAEATRDATAAAQEGNYVLARELLSEASGELDRLEGPGDPSQPSPAH